MLKKALATALAITTLIQLTGAVAYSVPIKVTDGTIVRVKTTTKLKSGESKVGEAVPFKVVEDVVGPGNRILIAKNATAIGKITTSKKRGMLGKSGKLEFTIESVKAVDGTNVPLRANAESQGKNNQNAVIAGALVLSVFAVFISGKDVEIKEGTQFTAYTDGDLTIDPDATGSTSPAPVAAVTAPAAKLTVTSSFAATNKIIGELKNESPAPTDAEIYIFIRKNGTVIGAGNTTIQAIPAGGTKGFTVPIDGSTKGDIDIQATPTVAPAAQPPIQTTTAPSAN